MSTQITNVHDAFFKSAIADPHLAGALLREHLPPEVADQLSADPPEPVPASFVDESLRQHHADLLFRLHLNGGDDALAYVLLEHKSAFDPEAPLQLLRYVVQILVNWRERNSRHRRLPPVVALVVHQGPPTHSGPIYPPSDMP